MINILWLLLAIPGFIILFFYKINRIPESLKSKEIDSHREQIVEIKDKKMLVQILKENIGNVVTIQSKDLTCVYENRLIEDNREITGKILDVDDDWLNIEFDSRQFIKKDSSDQLVFRIDRINKFFVNRNFNS